MKIMHTPLLFAINIRSRIHHAYGLAHYPFLRARTHLLPVLTQPSHSTEDRAALLARAIKAKLKELGTDRYHLACFSCSGIDGRLALTNPSLPKPVKFVSLMSPNRGSLLAELFQQKALSYGMVEAVTRGMGVYPESLGQFVTCEMNDFNLGVHFAPGVEYYSVGA
jgi:hypothetical protein